MNLLYHIQVIVNSMFEDLQYDLKFARVTKSQREGFDFQCNGAMGLGKSLGKPSLEVAEHISSRLRLHQDVSSVVVSGNGFINIIVADILLESNLHFNVETTVDPKRILVDFGGPNVAKPLHVGHLRSLVIGESLRRILKERGHTVVSDIHLGDWGLQMGQLISQLQLEQPELVYFDPMFVGAYPMDPPITLEQLEQMYPKAAQDCKENPERLVLARQATAELQKERKGYLALWKHFKQLSLRDQLQDINLLGAHFDFLLGESDVNAIVDNLAEQLEEEGIAIPSDGALVIPVSNPTDKIEVPPLILKKSDGAAMYGATDLATIVARRNMDEIIYVVDQRQALHFEQVFRAAKVCDIETKLVHVGFGTVNGPDGKPFKTRSGDTVKLKQLISDTIAAAQDKLDHSNPKLAEQIAMAAIKFGDLQTNRLSGYNFDMDKFLEFEGKTGPYLQYAGVRIKAILAKLPEVLPNYVSLSTTYEHDLAVSCLGFASALEAASEELMPNRIAEYAFRLAQQFSRFYTNCQVLGEAPDIMYTRKCLIQLTFSVLEKSLYLLGIEIPDQM